MHHYRHPTPQRPSRLSQALPLGIACLLTVGALSACSRADAGTSAGSNTSSDAPSNSDFQGAITGGRLRFELRGLATDAKTSSYGGVTYEHKATVVVTGDSALAHQPMLLVYRATRLAGGDPGALRDATDFRLAQVTGGVGSITESGGYRTKEERWDPEKIELRIIGVLPITMLPTAGQSVARQQ